MQWQLVHLIVHVGVFVYNEIGSTANLAVSCVCPRSWRVRDVTQLCVTQNQIPDLCSTHFYYLNRGCVAKIWILVLYCRVI